LSVCAFELSLYLQLPIVSKKTRGNSLRKVAPILAKLRNSVPYYQESSNLLLVARERHTNSRANVVVWRRERKLSNPVKLRTVALLARSSHLPARHSFSCSGSLLDNEIFHLANGSSSANEPSDLNAPDSVEFEAVEHLALENSQEVVLNVFRRGLARSHLRVDFENLDINIGKTFIRQFGSVSFEPGQKHAKILIQVSLANF
jgi:hypothetical protein